MNAKSKNKLIRIIITSIIFFPLLILEHHGMLEGYSIYIQLVLFLFPYGIIGYDIISKAFRNIKNGQVFDENFLMMLATLGAFVVREFSESVAVMLFYQVGELFQAYAVGKSRQAIADMMDIAPEYAYAERDGVIEELDPDDVEVGSIIVVRAGEKVPIDGVVIEGESSLDTKALTGEAVPRSIKTGEEIFSGCINGSGTLKVKTTKAYEDSTVARILELVEEAGDKKAKVENFITRFARYYTPIVTIGALILAVVGPIASNLLMNAGIIAYSKELAKVSTWILRACTFLVVSCPCALVISIPMGFFGGIGAASCQGILVKGSAYLELMSNADTVVFDKTGTLTKGEFKVQKIETMGEMSEADILKIAAHAESMSSHPIAKSIVEAYEEKETRIEASLLSDIEEIAGHGISARIDGKCVLAGNLKLLKANGINADDVDSQGAIVYVAVDGKYEGAIIIADTVKDEALEAIKAMKAVGVSNTVMLTGDRENAAAYAASELRVDKYYSELLPDDKVAKVEELLSNKKSNTTLAFVGDGINDAPVLTRADVGIAMGMLGSDAAIEAADIVLMDDDVRKIAAVVRISRKTKRIVRQNIVFALTVKILVLILSAAGITNMWAAVFADVGVAVLAIMNAMRCLGTK